MVEIKDGAALWTNPNWELIGQIGKSYGLEWGASFNDRPHFQLAMYAISELLSGTSQWSYISSYFDDPQDSQMIELGYYYFYQMGGCY